MSDTVLVALITGGMSLIGIIITQIATAASNRKKIKSDMEEQEAITRKLTEKKLIDIEEKLDNHIKIDEMETAVNKRVRILEFNEGLYNKSINWPSEGSFLQVKIDCDDYNKYINSHEIPNGIAEDAMKHIKETYELCKQENLFGEKKS